MKLIMLLFWIFTVPVHTFVLQPSANMTVLRNISVEGDLWQEQGHHQLSHAFNTEEETMSEEKVTIQEETDKKNKEHGIMTTETEQRTTESDVEQKNVEKLEEQNLDGQMLDVNKPILTALNNTHSEEVEGGEHLSPSVNQYSTPTMASVSQPVLRLNGESVTPPPLFPSVSQRPASTPESLSIKKNAAHSSKSTAEIATFHIVNSSLETLGASLIVNESSTNDDITVKLHVMNNTKLHPLEEVSVDVTAMAARAGPTAKAPARNAVAKPKNKVAGAKPKDNKTLTAKKKKTTKSKVKKTTKVEKILKKSKKVTKLKQERKLKPTTSSYFPYFEDHYCPSECSCYGRVVQCSDKHLEKIPYGIPYNSRYILVMNNKIDSIQLSLLSGYESMEFLVLSNNRLTDAAMKGSLEGIKNLKRLYVEQNLLQSIPTDLPSTLEELRLDRNQISVMSDAAFARCPNLLILSLSNNSLGNKSSTIPPGVLLPLAKLRTLTLSNNQLTSVPLQLPLSLRELYLRGNRIQRLHGDMFWGQAELQILDLSLNRLTNKGLGKAALLNATRLESLNLEGNLLKQVPHHLPHSIKTLNLEGNHISSISKDAFISMPQLEHLGLARNKITKVALGAFRVLPLLHQIDMSHNALQQVPRQLPLWLHSVTFAHNKIRSIPRDSFCLGQGNESPLSRLVNVHLEYNMIDLGHLDTLAFRCLRGFQVVQFY